MKQVFLVALACILSFSGMAQRGKKNNDRRDRDNEQTEERHSTPPRDVLRSGKPLTWLGLDFTQVVFIGSATQYGSIGEITDDQIREKYVPAWNELFVYEQKRYDVPKYLDRSEVTYATNITEKINNKKGPKTFFSDDPGEFHHVDEAMIARLVKGYDFMGKKGIGVVFFVEGMSKGRTMASAWVTFVDMGTRSVLQTARIEGKPSGFGFRNYWAGAFLNILKKVTDELR